VPIVRCPRRARSAAPAWRFACRQRGGLRSRRGGRRHARHAQPDRDLLRRDRGAASGRRGSSQLPLDAGGPPRRPRIRPGLPMPSLDQLAADAQVVCVDPRGHPGGRG
jgi:hypothetical protein